MAHVKNSSEVKSKFDNTMFGNGVTISSEVVRTKNDHACANPSSSTCINTSGRPACSKVGTGCGSTNKLKIHN